MIGNIVKEGVVYRRSKILKNWKPRYFVLTKDKFFYFIKYKNEKPKRIEDIDKYTPEWPGTQKGKIYMFKLFHKEHAKRNLTLGLLSKEAAEEWAKCFMQKPTTSPTEDPPDDQSVKSLSPARTSQIFFTNKRISRELPKGLEIGLKKLKETDNWKLIGDMEWKFGNWYKTTMIVPSPSKLLVEALQEKRAEWDWLLPSFRIISSPENSKLFLGKLKNKQFVLLSFIHTEQPFSIYILQETVSHDRYPSKINFAEYFLISQHPYQSNLSQLTRVTNIPDFKDSLKGIINYVEFQQFFASAADFHLEDQLTNSEVKNENESPNINPSEPMSFSEFFVYGEGGRYERDEINGALIFKDKELITKQRQVLSHMLRSMGKNLLSGKSIMTVSLPVYIFDKRSILQTMCAYYGYAPIFLEKAAKATGFERFKQFVTWGISWLHLPTEQLKPFNPILGETFQGFLGKTPVFAEQTFHHPPISHFQVIGENYTLQGYNEFNASTSANSMKARQRGLTQVTIGDKSYYLSYPQCLITGTIMGKRYFNWQGVMSFMAPDEGYFCEVLLNPDKKGGISGMFSKSHTPQDYFRGYIQKVTANHVMMTEQGRKSIVEDGKKPVVSNPDDIEQELSSIEGYWTLYLDIDGVRYWSFNDYRPFILTPAPSILPSDSSLRPDLKAMIKDNVEESQIQKDILENIQRRDRKLRADYSKNAKNAKSHH